VNWWFSGPRGPDRRWSITAVICAYARLQFDSQLQSELAPSDIVREMLHKAHEFGRAKRLDRKASLTDTGASPL